MADFFARVNSEWVKVDSDLDNSEIIRIVKIKNTYIAHGFNIDKENGRYIFLVKGKNIDTVLEKAKEFFE